MSKGGAKVAQQNAGIGQSYSQGYQGDASGISGTELPFLQNELTNPQGFDPTDLSKMRTSSSQSIAGAEGAGKEEARGLSRAQSQAGRSGEGALGQG